MKINNWFWHQQIKIKEASIGTFFKSVQNSLMVKNLLVFNKGMKKLLKESMTYRDYESEANLMDKC